MTDNNPLTYVLTTAKLDATGQRWVAALSAYNFYLTIGVASTTPTQMVCLGKCHITQRVRSFQRSSRI